MAVSPRFPESCQLSALLGEGPCLSYSYYPGAYDSRREKKVPDGEVVRWNNAVVRSISNYFHESAEAIAGKAFPSPYAIYLGRNGRGYGQGSRLSPSPLTSGDPELGAQLLESYYPVVRVVPFSPGQRLPAPMLQQLQSLNRSQRRRLIEELQKDLERLAYFQRNQDSSSYFGVASPDPLDTVGISESKWMAVRQCSDGRAIPGRCALRLMRRDRFQPPFLNRFEYETGGRTLAHRLLLAWQAAINQNSDWDGHGILLMGLDFLRDICRTIGPSPTGSLYWPIDIQFFKVRTALPLLRRATTPTDSRLLEFAPVIGGRKVTASHGPVSLNCFSSPGTPKSDVEKFHLGLYWPFYLAHQAVHDLSSGEPDRNWSHFSIPSISPLCCPPFRLREKIPYCLPPRPSSEIGQPSTVTKLEQFRATGFSDNSYCTVPERKGFDLFTGSYQHPPVTSFSPAPYYGSCVTSFPVTEKLFQMIVPPWDNPPAQRRYYSFALDRAGYPERCLSLAVSFDYYQASRLNIMVSRQPEALGISCLPT